MLHEFVGSRAQPNQAFSQPKSATGSSYLSNYSKPSSFELWETNENNKRSRNSSSTVLPEISEFLREETGANTQTLLPFSGSFVKFLELDDPNTSEIKSDTDRLDEDTESTASDAKRLRVNLTLSDVKKPLPILQQFGSKNKEPPKMHDKAKKKDSSASFHLIGNGGSLNISKTNNFSLASKSQPPSLPAVSVSKYDNNNKSNVQSVPLATFTNFPLGANHIRNQTQLLICSENEVKKDEHTLTSPCFLHDQVTYNEYAGSNGHVLPAGNGICTTEQLIGSSVTSDFLQLCNNKGLHFNDCHSVGSRKTDSYPKYPDNAGFVKTEREDAIAQFYPPSRTDPVEFRELPWSDANKETEINGNSHLQLSMSNSLLNDVDLSGVDTACMEQFEKRYQQEALKETEHACSVLNIPINAEKWSEFHVDKWIMWTAHQCNLPAFNISDLRMSGIELCKLGEADMLSRVPTCGDIIHARLSIWKSAAKIIENQALPELNTLPPNTSQNTDLRHVVETTNHPSVAVTMTKRTNEMSESDATSQLKPPHTSSIHLWMFLKELLLQPQLYGQFIRWIDKEEGIFKIEDSMEVARLWGIRKNRPAMNYDKLSRSIRQYYKKGIIKKTPVSQRLVYQFVNPALTMPI